MGIGLGKFDLVVVGAGFFGLTCARLAADAGYRVLVIEKRNHIGGNAYSYIDDRSGVEVHRYGSHLFHTSNKRVWDFVNQFSRFNDYRHTVKTVHKNQVFQMPINLGTISQFFGYHLTPNMAREKISQSASEFSPGDDFESKALSQIGPELYEAFIKNYTKKQWQTDPANLPGEIFSRLPVRYNFNDRYFFDTWEGLPTAGYFGLFKNLSSHKNIHIELETDFFSLKSSILQTGKPIVYTGALDRFFDYRFGSLQWRTLDFRFETLELDDFQGASVVNYADLDDPHTRVHEFKHLHPERTHRPGVTTVAWEYSRWADQDDEPYYPVNSAEDRSLVLKYRSLIQEEKGVFFGGRLGSYQYLDMHMAIASAFVMFENKLISYLKSV